MEVDFVVQDLFAQLRPKWVIATTLEEASKNFAEACKVNFQQSAAASREAEPEPEADDADDMSLSEGEDKEDVDDVSEDGDGRSASESEAEVRQTMYDLGSALTIDRIR